MDLKRIRDNIENYPECFRFNVVMGKDILNALVEEFRKEEGGQAADRPKILEPRGEGKRTDQ